MYGGDGFKFSYNWTVYTVPLSEVLVSVRIAVSVDPKSVRVGRGILPVILEGYITGDVVPTTLGDVDGLVFLLKPHAT